jgi:hypothetical protein
VSPKNFFSLFLGLLAALISYQVHVDSSKKSATIELGYKESLGKEKGMVRWEHVYLLGTMVFRVMGDVVRDFDEEYEAWSWLEQEGWGLVAIEPPDPIKPGLCKYYFKRQQLPAVTSAQTRTTTGLRAIELREQHRRK